MYTSAACQSSSVGESVAFITLRSWVRLPPLTPCPLGTPIWTGPDMGKMTLHFNNLC